MLRTTLLPACLLAVLLCAAGTARAAQDDNADLNALREEMAQLRTDLDTLMDVRLERPQFSGYIDVDLTADNRSGSPATFRAHHLTLFVTRQWQHARVFSELEFENGTDYQGSGGAVTGSGKVMLETVWAEYNQSASLNLRAGKLLLPQYWNVNHYPTTVLTTRRPLMVRDVFPTDVTGVMLHGSDYPGDLGYGYALYVGNGQGPDPAAHDDNANKSVGLHLVAHLGDALARVARLDVAVTGYSERTTADGARDIYGAEVQMDAGRLGLLAEYAARAEQGHEGFYVQPSWRLANMLFGVYRHDHLDDGAAPSRRDTLGVDWRPVPNLSLKTSVDHTDVTGGEDYDSVNASVAAFF